MSIASGSCPRITQILALLSLSPQAQQLIMDADPIHSTFLKVSKDVLYLLQGTLEVISNLLGQDVWYPTGSSGRI